MRRPALYSRSPRAPQQAEGVGEVDQPQASMGPAHASDAADDAAAAPAAPSAPRRRFGWRSGIALTVLLSALGASGYYYLPPQTAHQLTQKDIDAAVLRSLQTASLPSAAARAADIIRPSVVEVVALGPEKSTPAAKVEKRGRNLARGKPPQADPPPGEVERGVGTGVVIVDKGVILTNLHVVAGAEKIKVTFADGLEANASIIGLQPENDLAVLQADKIPDDLFAATMRSTGDLQPGDNVAVVGFPFGIGPSVSAGVVSGLKRSFRSPEGQQEMSNLIQFDAAANPGNSGGPLVNMNGEVLGIVTAILNPTQQRTFIGIGFAVPIENAASAAGMPPF
ncbi:S1C family serine protease [Variovorax sp. LARHSF232]